ncbi:hypothetical protein E2E30_08750 [Sphingomonas sp. AAP5]|uniref:hypothetical protein n=1 Tax=Sphingomonas sp. UYEF23 TaxID=1756408 RepID=UPI0010570407|nr:hypothetical protein E2E30_08750 [Sphingomonas sp. AAP5]
MFAATFIAGLLVQMIFPRQRWIAAAVIAVGPLAALTATVWWGVWDRDPLYAVAYFTALLICCAASISSLLMVDVGRRTLRR